MGKILLIWAGGAGIFVAHKLPQLPEVFTEILLTSIPKSKCDILTRSIGN